MNPFEKDVLTTGEVAKICNVASRTVSKWFDSGQLRGYRIPGSKDRRIPVNSLVKFMKSHGIPMDGLMSGSTRVLIVHDDPSTMSRYRLRIGGREEFQKSSGLWVASAAGSSSAVLAAGGVRLPWTSRKFQYRPRELYRGRLSRCRLTGKVLASGARVHVAWLMRRGNIFIDGPHVRIPLRFADRIEVRSLLGDPLRVLGLPARRRVNA